jgi:hypothetical protein
VNLNHLLEAVRPAPRPDAAKRGQRSRRRPAAHATRVPFALLVTLLIAGGMGLLLLLNTASAANEVRRHDLSARGADMAAQVQELQNEVAASAAPGNLARAAAALGMVPAANPAFLVIGADGSVRVLGSPAPASYVHVLQQQVHKKKKKKKPASTSTASATKTTTGTAHATTAGGRSSTAAAKSAAKSSTAPRPTPTPTPTLTLPGGNR